MEILLVVLVGIISVLVAFLLIYLSGLSTYIKAKGLKSQPIDTSLGDLSKTLFKNLSELKINNKKVEEVSKNLLEIFNKELQRHINIHTEQLTSKYERIIDEKSKNEEIAWKKYKKILSDKKQTEAVIHSIAEGLIVVDSEGKVIMMNPAAERLLGVSKKEKIGKGLIENLKNEQLVSLIKPSSEAEDKEIELLSGQEETKKILKASTAVVENEDGRTVGMVSVLSDITKQKELDDLKSKFISTITHELRTPLIAIEKSLSLLFTSKKNELEKKEQELISIAERNLKRLIDLINDILDFSKLQAKKVELKKELVSIEEIIEDIIKTFNSWAIAKSVSINKQIEADLPKVSIDVLKINEVFDNLIGNALKFTSAGGSINIEAKLDNNKNSIRITIKDTGVGIPKEELSKIFDKFYQVSASNPSDVVGSGLGLSIVKEIIKLHGGTIWAESDGINKGATFIFTLPLD